LADFIWGGGENMKRGSRKRGGGNLKGKEKKKFKIKATGVKTGRQKLP
jgi:hypothetical protein